MQTKKEVQNVFPFLFNYKKAGKNYANKLSIIKKPIRCRKQKN